MTNAKMHHIGIDWIFFFNSPRSAQKQGLQPFTGYVVCWGNYICQVSRLLSCYLHLNNKKA